MASSTSRPMPSQSTFNDDVTGDFGDWMQAHGRQVGIGVGVVVALALGGMLWRSNQTNKSTRADAAYLQARQAVLQGDQGGAERDLRQVAQRYDGTAGGAQAQLTLAQLLFDQGKYQDGMNVLNQASDAPKSLSNAVRILMAAGYEGLGKFKDAGKTYEDAANAATTTAAKTELKANAARASQAAGDRGSAIKAWQELAAMPDAGVSDEARIRLGELLGSAAP